MTADVATTAELSGADAGSGISVLPARSDALDAVTRALTATAEQYDRSGGFPTDGIRAVHEAGLLTATVGTEYGGAQLGIGGTARLLAALGEGDPSVALIAAMTLLTHLREAQRPHWPPHLYQEVIRASRERPTLLNAARVEPELGSPARGGLPATVARRTAHGWSISGRKRFVTGAEGLAYFLVWAGTDEPTPRIATFVVPGDSPGIEIHRDWDQLGLRASGSHDVSFTDVEIPAENLLDPVERGAAAEQDNRALAALGLTVAALYLGVGRAAQRAFHRFAHERVPANLGRPIAETDRFRDAAGEIEVNLAGAQQLLYSVADQYDRGERPEPAVGPAARILAIRQVNAAVALATRLLGNPGLSRGGPLERHFRDIQFAAIHAPQDDIVLRQVGTGVLGAASPGAQARSS
jgi:alkylation response protein AidB-like acyl-CoA dehydrogenase